jgi:hypothetical protein
MVIAAFRQFPLTLKERGQILIQRKIDANQENERLLFGNGKLFDRRR